MGVTSIGMVGNTYSQNERGLDEYYTAIDNNKLAVFRGIELTKDDLIRRDVITCLICNFVLDYASIEQAWGIRFADYFANELARLPSMASDGLLEMDADGIRVLPRGRLLIRNVCMAFDHYLSAGLQQKNFSKVI